MVLLLKYYTLWHNTLLRCFKGHQIALFKKKSRWSMHPVRTVVKLYYLNMAANIFYTKYIQDIDQNTSIVKSFLKGSWGSSLIAAYSQNTTNILQIYHKSTTK